MARRDRVIYQIASSQMASGRDQLSVLGTGHCTSGIAGRHKFLVARAASFLAYMSARDREGR
jgi:hypothetical protein